MPEEKVMTEAIGRIDSLSWGRLRNSIASLFVLIILVLVISRSAWAQETASLNGTVHASTGAVVPDADVTLLDTQKGSERKTATNDAGIYVFVSIPPGVYNLTVDKVGFARSTQETLTLLVNQSITQDFTLNLGTTQQAVSVEASAVNLETANATLGTVINSKQVTDLPLNGRNFTQLLALTPGVAPISTAQNSGGGQARPIGAFAFPSVNGQQNRSNYFMLDGIDDNDMVFSTYALAPVVDEVQEFKVQSHNDEVQFGGVTGAIINVVTKSGTNDYHATAWEYLRNTVLNARNPFSGLSTLIQNQFGASGGGPVRLPHYDGRNKTFFYGTYEGFRRVSPASNFYNVPTAAELTGDFSDICQTGFTGGICNDRKCTIVANPCPLGNQLITHQLYNPSTTAADPAKPGQFTRTAIANNNIASLRNASAVTFGQDVFLTALPLINGFNGHDFRSSHTAVQQYSWRIDENFNPSNSVFFRYSTASQPNTGSGGSTNFNSVVTVDATQYVASFYHPFSPSTTFDFQFGHVEITNGTVNRFAGDTAKAIADGGFSPNFACGFAGGFAPCMLPTMAIADNYVSAGEGVSITHLTNIYEWRGNLTKIIRNHPLTGGFSYEDDRFAVASLGLSDNFSANQTADPQNAGNTGNALASFYLGVPSQGNRRQTVAPVTGQKGVGVYFMDKWKVTDRFTLNLGLRYDIQLYPMYGNPKDGTSAIGEIDFNNGTYILQRPVASCSQTGNAAPCIPGTSLPANVVISPNGRLWKNTKTNFQPRLGLAYRLTNKTVMRASFGITDDLWAGITQTVQGIGGIWPSHGQPQVSQNAANVVAVASFQNPIGTGVNTPDPTPFTQVAFYRDPQAKNPYSEQWNFGFERQFSGNTVVDVNYVGSQSHRLVVGGLYNTALTPGPNLNPDGTTATGAQIPAAFAARQPWPFITPTFYDRSVGKGSYNALQVSARHQAQHGLSYGVSYTYSKAIDEASDGFFGVEGQSSQDPYNLARDRSVAGFDLPHVLAVNFTAESPFGKGKRFTSNNGVVDYIVGNWQLNGIYTYTSGRNFSLAVPGDSANTRGGNSGTYLRPNLVGDPNSGSCPNGAPVHTVACWFNTSAFALPAAFTFGNLGRNTLRGQRHQILDMSLFRSFPFAEKRKLEFRAEAFNILNHPTLGNPNGTFNNANFGKITSTRSTERQLQLALKLIF